MLLRLSGLKDLQVRHSLAVLIQQHLALWYTSEDTTFYEADWEHAYNLVRSGKIIKTVEDRFGSFAGGLISNLLTLGHTQVGDLARAYEALSPDKTPGYVNGESAAKPVSTPSGKIKSDEKESNSTRKSFDSTLRSLMRTGYVTVVHESHFRSAADNRYEAEIEIGLPVEKHAALTRQKKSEFGDAVANKLSEWKYGADFTAKETLKTPKKLGKGKRKRDNGDSDDERSSRKKVRVDLANTNHMNGGSSSTETSDLDVSS